jgi:hypothetical protein
VPLINKPTSLRLAAPIACPAGLESEEKPLLSIVNLDVVPAAPLDTVNKLDVAADAVSVNEYVTPGNTVVALFHVCVDEIGAYGVAVFVPVVGPVTVN